MNQSINSSMNTSELREVCLGNGKRDTRGRGVECDRRGGTLFLFLSGPAEWSTRKRSNGRVDGNRVGQRVQYGACGRVTQPGEVSSCGVRGVILLLLL